ncbi:MAG TPA: MFS transporter [Tepidiformaceae bacterium]
MVEAEASSAAPSRQGLRSRLFYGWWIVIAGAGVQFLQSSLLGQAYGAYVVLLRDEFGWGKTLLSGAAALREAETGLVGPAQGWLLDRFGPRVVARTGVVILAVGFMLFSRIQSPLTFYAAFIVMSIGASLMGYLTITFTVVQWFERRRSTAISLASAGFALGGMAVPIVVVLLEAFGWRATAFGSGVFVLLVGLPLTQVLRHHPSELGLAPDGDGAVPVASARSGLPLQPHSTDFTLREALHEPSFWWISLGHASALFVVSAMGVHLVSHLTESQGYSLGQASATVFAMTFLFLVGTISGGLLGDRLNKRLLVVCCMVMHMAGLLLLSHATNLGMVVAFVILHGLAWGWRGPQMAALRADYFGRAAFGKILGVSNVVIILGTISGPLIAGFMYDRTGNYRIGFDFIAGIALAGSIFFILARKPPPPARSVPTPAPPLSW